MTTLSDKLLAISVAELIKKNEHLAKLYPNKLYGQFAIQLRERYFKLTGKEYISPYNQNNKPYKE